MALGIGLYPGIEQIISANFTFSAHGTVPSAAVLEITPQAEYPAARGTLVFTFGNVAIPFPDCKLNLASFARNQNGLIWSLQILDRRTWWSERTISGSYNLRKQDETLDTDTETTPQELAGKLLDAMGESGYDVSALPNDTRPMAQWAYENAANALDSLCDSLGCRVVLDYTKNRVKICVLGIGAQLPEPPIVVDDSGSIDPPEVPDGIRVVFGETRVQGLLKLKPVGLDTDGDTKDIDDLSYAPAAGWGATIPGRYLNLANTDPTGAGNLSNSPRALATKTVWRWYQLDGFVDTISRFQRLVGAQLGTDFGFFYTGVDQFLPILPETLDIDSATGDAYKPYVQGVFAKLDGIWGNTAAWTDYTKSFSLIANKGIVDFSDYVFKWTTAGSATSTVSAATIYLNCCFTIKHPSTREVHRVYRRMNLGGNNGTGDKVVRVEEISGALKIKYDANGEITRFISNRAALNQEADFQLKAARAQFQVKAPRDITYAGLVVIAPDGAIQQITFAAKQGVGCTTRASRNNEYHLAIPNYRERQRIKQVALNGAEQTARQLRRAVRLQGGVM